MQISRFQPVTVPEDLAAVLIDEGLAVAVPPDMSAVPGLIESLNVVAMWITLSDGPAKVDSLVKAIRRWFKNRGSDGKAVGVIELRDQSGLTCTVPFASDSDIERIAEALAILLNTSQAHHEVQRREFDGIEE